MCWVVGRIGGDALLCICLCVCVLFGDGPFKEEGGGTRDGTKPLKALMEISGL